MSELYHKQIASAMDLDSILVSGDRVPSVLNGGLSNVWIGAAAAVALLIGGLLEFKTFESVSWSVVVLFIRSFVCLVFFKMCEYVIIHYSVASPKSFPRGNCDVLLVCWFFFTFDSGRRREANPATWDSTP